MTQGTYPSRKSRNLRDLRQYLNVGCLDANGLLVVYKQDPFFHWQKLVIVPTQILSGILTALIFIWTIQPTHQLTQVFQRYFYAIKSGDNLAKIANNCDQCNALKSIPKEMIKQTSSPSPHNTRSRICQWCNEKEQAKNISNPGYPIIIHFGKNSPISSPLIKNRLVINNKFTPRGPLYHVH